MFSVIKIMYRCFLEWTKVPICLLKSTPLTVPRFTSGKSKRERNRFFGDNVLSKLGGILLLLSKLAESGIIKHSH